MQRETSGLPGETDYSYPVNKTSVKTLTSGVSGSTGVRISGVEEACR